MAGKSSKITPTADQKAILELALKDPAGVKKRIQTIRCEQPDDGLINFVRVMWPFVEPSRDFVDNWHIHAICEHLEAVSKGEITRLLINVPPGFMKDVSIDAKVLTKRGRINLGDVVVGDMILTHHGRFRSVLAVHDQGCRPTLTIVTDSGRRIAVHPDHPFLTPGGWRPAKDLAPNSVLAAVVALESLDDVITAEEARLLGYLVGDGGVTHSPIFVNGDEEVLNDFEYCAAVSGFSTARRTPPPSQSGKNVLATTIGLRGAKKWLTEHQLAGRSSYNKRIPNAVLRSGREIIANFLGAYWSCDGTIQTRHTGKRGSIFIASCTTVSADLAEDVQHALLRIGIAARVRRKAVKLESKKQPGGIYVSYNVQSRSYLEVEKFTRLVGLCSRKSVALIDMEPQSFQRTLIEDRIIEIIDSGETETRCLTVDEDCSFTANDLAVHNSLLSNVFWPAWEWGPRNMPSMRYVAASYSQDLTIRDNVRFRQIITGDDYVERWGGRFEPSKIQFSLEKVGNTKTGWKLATSTGGVGTGERGDRVIIDDPNNVKDVESDKVRDGVNRWLTEVVPTRLNDPAKSAIIIIQQRTHEEDASGTVLARDLEYEHLMIPMRYDSSRRFVTVIGWTDPRGVDATGNEIDNDGALAWPERFPLNETDKLERTLGPYAFAGQFQQSPVPRGGAIFDRDWWVPYCASGTTHDGKIRFPKFEYVVASVDTAFSEKQEGDYSAMTVWGVWRDSGESFVAPRHVDDPTDLMRIATDDRPKVMLIYGWQKRLALHGPPEQRPPNVSLEEWGSPWWRQQRQKTWGLVEWVVDTARRYRVDMLLIETQAAGKTLDQELRRLHSTGDWGITMLNAKGDKVARAVAVQHLFSNGLVHCPMYPDTGLPPLWASEIVDQFSSFPKTRYKDLVDSGTHALQHLRDAGVLVRKEEHDSAFEEGLRVPKRPKPLYDV